MSDIKIPDGVQLAPVDKYVPNGDQVRTTQESLLAEGRVGVTDQIPDYHEKNPTLDASGPAYDQAVHDALIAQATPAPKKADLKAAAAALDAATTPPEQSI